jgi:branched-chain amino acid transport system ATP-binding protein
MSEQILNVAELCVTYGPAQALFDISMTANRGEVVAILGANGAGKSSFARAISGLVPASGGAMEFDGQDITTKAPYQIRRAGLTYIPEGRGIFPGLSVSENLRMAVAQVKRSERRPAIERAMELFPILGQRSSQRAGSLSGGEQQMLALARALAVTPQLIIADEMSLGLAPIVTEEVFQSLERARDEGITILLIEQFVHRALQLADRAIILSRGHLTWSGAASEAGAEVLESYLGAGAEV